MTSHVTSVICFRYTSISMTILRPRKESLTDHCLILVSLKMSEPDNFHYVLFPLPPSPLPFLLPTSSCPPPSPDDMSASELKKLQRKQKKAKLKAQAKAQEEMKGLWLCI